jgi:alkylation response protein AidB-like acyl-CoA dehydrogenase
MNGTGLSRRDLDFLLYEWLGVTALTARPRYSEHSRETFDAALDTFAEVAADHFALHNRSNDVNEPTYADGTVRVNPPIRAALAAFSAAGLGGTPHDYALGGMQLPYTVERAGMALLFAANVSTSAYPMLSVANANLLLAHADPGLVERYVPELLAGRMHGTMCLSEPQAGSSLADIATRAEPQADGRYRLHGNKMWISAGEHDLTDNILHLVLAKVPGPDGKLRPGVQGISLFAVPKFLPAGDGAELGERNDVIAAGLNHKLGYRGTSNCVLNFGEGRFRPEGRPGALGTRVGAEGQGLACMFHMMNEARIGVGVGAVALGYTGYRHALEYARTRRQGRVPSTSGKRASEDPPVPIIRHADVRRMLLAQKSYVEGGLGLVLYCAHLVDDLATAPEPAERDRAKRLLELLTPVAKSWPSQWCLAANDLAIQVHGGYGYTRDYPVEQFWRDNRLNPIHEGTHGIQAADLLGRKVGMEGGTGLRALDAAVAATVAGAEALPELRDEAGRVAGAWRQVLAVTRRLGEVPDAALRLANSARYLEAFGHAVVGWLWLAQALVAARALANASPPPSESDAAFYAGKIQACRWFARWELPNVGAWLAVLDPVDTTTLEMHDAWF